MPRQPCNFRQSDLTRALKGAQAAGIVISRIDISKDGKISVIVGNPMEEPEVNSADRNEWDELQ